MSTIGDPLADLGWLLSYWPDPGDDRSNPGMATMLPEPGFLTRREMLDRYEAKTGRKMTNFPFYQAFAIFKLAIIMEGSYSAIPAWSDRRSAVRTNEGARAGAGR